MPLLNQLRGMYRIGPPGRLAAVPTSAQQPAPPMGGDMPGQPEPPPPPDDDEGWLSQSRKLIPGEALAGYIALQALAETATEPGNVRIVLAIVFLFVTFFLRYVGSQESESGGSKSVQWGVVIISGLSFVFLVYASGGQIVWHEPVADQQLYAQILAFALGIVGPYINKAFTKDS